MSEISSSHEEEMYQLKTMCLAKRTVQMPNKDEHGFLLFCGLGARKWKIGMESNNLSFKQAILNIYPRLRSVIGYNLWTLSKDKKTFERIPEKVNSPRRIRFYLGAQFTGCLIIVPVSDIVLMEERREHLRQMDIKDTRSATIITPAPATDRKLRSVCLVCGKIEKTAGTGTFHKIVAELMPFQEGSITISRKLSDVLGINLEAQKRRFMTSEEVCKKCLRSLIDLVQLEEKIKLAKEDLISSFFNTTSKFNKVQSHSVDVEEEREIPPVHQSSPYNLNLYNYAPGYLVPSQGHNHQGNMMNSHQRSYKTTQGMLHLYPGYDENVEQSRIRSIDDRSSSLYRRTGGDLGDIEFGQARREYISTGYSNRTDESSESGVSPRPFDQGSLASTFSYSGFETRTRTSSLGDQEEQRVQGEEGIDGEEEMINPQDKLIIKFESISPISDEKEETSTPPAAPLSYSPGSGGEISTSPQVLNTEEENARERRKPMKKRKRAPEPEDEDEYKVKTKKENPENDHDSSHYEDQVDNSNSDITDGDQP